MNAVEKPNIADYRRHLLVCTGPRCTTRGESQALFDSLGAIFKAAGLDQGELRVKRSRVSCFAACRGGPILCVQPPMASGTTTSRRRTCSAWYANIWSAAGRSKT